MNKIRTERGGIANDDTEIKKGLSESTVNNYKLTNWITQKKWITF